MATGEDGTVPGRQTATLHQAGLLGLLVAIVVVALRLAAYVLTHSLAVLADAVEPLLDVVAALVTLAGVTAARQPADAQHPFGHRKLEFVAVGVNGAVALAGAGVVLYAGAYQWVYKLPVAAELPAIGLFLLSLLLRYLLSRVQLDSGDRYASPAVRAAGRHALIDVWVGLAVVANLCLVWIADWRWADVPLSLAVLGAVAWAAIRLLRRSVVGLMDTAEPAVRARAVASLEAALTGPAVAYHDLRCRDAGGIIYVDFHLQFAPGTSLEAAHGGAERVELAVEAELGSADATAHIEPASEVRADRAAPPPVVSEHERARRRAASLSLAVALSLVGVKMAAYLLTRSAAVLSDALETLVNVVAAGFAVYSVRLARKGADADHPYGHYKVEFIAAGFEGALIAVAALLIFATAAPRLWSPRELQHLDAGLALLGGAALTNGALGWHLISVGRRLESLTLEADGRHVLTDVWTSAAVLVGLLLVRLTHWPWADPLVAMGVAAYILVTGASLMRRSVQGMMDTVDTATFEAAARVLNQAQQAARIVGWHQLRVRDAGARRFIDAHIQLPEGVGLAAAHEVTEQLEAELEARLGPAEAILHAEPASEVR